MRLFSALVVAALASSSLVLATFVCFGHPTHVNLRIEGATETMYEGDIVTCGHNVTTVSGGTHRCDGTNNNANPTPGPTCTSALDMSSLFAGSGFTWDGTYFSQFDDFFITRIEEDAQTSTQFWGILLNYQFIPVGGCQQQVKKDDQVLFAFDAFSKAHVLKLDGPATASINRPVQITVTDGSTGLPIAGAAVDGQTSDANGHILLTFNLPGLKHLKAEKTDSIRSNMLIIFVAQHGNRST